MKKKMFTLWMTGLFLLLTTLGATAQNSGTIPGSSFSWQYIPSTKTLSITGSGAMPDFNFINQPWEPFQNQIETITIGAGVTSVGKTAFTGCRALKSVTLPAGLQTIEENAFLGCSALASITLPSSLQTIGEDAFGGCSALTSIELPAALETIGVNALNAGGLTEIKVQAGNTHFEAAEGVLYNKGKTTLLCYPRNKPGITFAVPASVTTIEAFAVYQCAALESITLPDALKTIGNFAFYKCTALKSVTIPKKVETIGDFVFQLCTGLKDVTVLWNTPLTITPGVFAGITPPTGVTLHVPGGTGEAYQGNAVWGKLTIEELPWGDFDTGLHWAYDAANHSLTITNPTPGSPKPIPDFANPDKQPWKAYRGEIQAVTIGAGVSSVGANAFHACEKLTSITLPNEVTTIGKRAFAGCKALTTVTLSAKLTTIGENAFYGCEKLTSITLPAGLKTLGVAAFNECDALTSIELPAALETIGEGALDARSLTEIKVQTGNTHFEAEGGVLYNKGKTTLLCYPRKKPGTTFAVPASVTTIGKYAFSVCPRLTSIELPKSLTTLKNRAFSGCSALKDVTVAWTDAASIPVIQSNAFDYLNLGGIKLHVPGGTKATYLTKEVWKQFSIVEEPKGDLSTGLHWEYDAATRTLTISNPNPGTPKSMPDFNSFDDQPWKDVREKIKTVVIETGVTGIGNKAFTGCEVLTSVTLPESGLETIGEKAFMGCEKLSSITIPKSVTTIKEQAFLYCQALGAVTVGWTGAGSIPNLPASAFSDPNGKVLHVPAGTAEMYKAKDEWKKFFIMDGKTAGGNLSTGLHWAYDDETKTLSITGAGEIPDYNYPNDRPWNAFMNKARTLTLAEGVTKIGKNAFASFQVLPSITLPKSVATIGEYAFINCHKLTDVTVAWTDNNIPIPHEQAFGLPGLVLHVPAGTVETYKTKDVWKRFFIMDGKTAGGDLGTGLHWEFNNETKTLSFTGQGEIPEYNHSGDQPWHAFWEKVQTVTLGEGVTKIGKRALCELRRMTSITIPKSVTEIGEEAFASSKSLTNFTVAWKDAGSIPDIQANVFNDVTLSDVTLYVPEGMVDTYKAKNVWKDFDIQETPPILSAVLTDAAPMAWTAGSTKQIKVQSNKKWKATIPAAAQTWLEFAGGDGITIVSESPDTTLTVKAKNANGITAARTATLDFVFEDGSGPATPVTVAVTQEAFSPTLSVTPATLTFTFDGEDKALTVTANRPWTAQCDAPWLTLSATSGTGNGTITVTAPAYEDEQPRTANIFFASGALKETVTVTQNPKPGPAFVALDYTELTLPAGASQRLVVTAYPKDADINRGVKWYSLNDDIATVSANGTVTALKPGRTEITVVANVGGQQTACRVRVVPAEQMVSVTSGGDNTLRLALVAPSDADFTLSFDVDLPEGFALDTKKTAPDASLAAGYAVTVTGKRVEMKPNGLRSGGTMEKRNLLTFACTAAPGTSKGSYKAALRNLSFTPTAGYALQNITVPFTFTHTVANQTIDGLRVYAAGGALHLTLPKAETVHIYNVVGSLVRTMDASAGDHVQPLPSGVYVVRVGERVTKILIK